MSRVAPFLAQPVQATPRGSMTRARRRRVHEAAHGLCGGCGKPVALHECEIEHPQTLWMGGSDDDADLRPYHVGCHKPKTKIDRTNIAKVKRILARLNGTRRWRKAIASPGFSRTLRRKLNGKVEAR